MRILLIAIYSPELNTSASIRTRYYIKHLSELGYKIDLIVPRYPEDFINFDESITSKYKNVEIHYADLGKAYRSGYSRKKKQTDSGLIRNKPVKRYFVNLVKKYLLIPDAYYKFRENAVFISENLLLEKKVDLLFTMHEPPSSHLIGRAIKRNNPKISWIAYWSDPWTFDPNRNYPLPRRLIEAKMQRDIIRYADCHFFTSEQTKKSFRDAYQNINFDAEIVFRGYEKELIESIKPIKMNKEKVNVVYAGEVYTKLRDLGQFIKSLKILQVEEPEIFNKLEFYFIGGIDDSLIEKELRNLGNVFITPRVSYQESIAYLKAADAMLLIGNNTGGQIPGKVYDYLGHKGPILTILGHNNDPLKAFKVLWKKGKVVENNYEEIGKSIKMIVENYIAKIRIEEWQKPAEEYEWSNVGVDLSGKIDKVLCSEKKL